MLFLSSLQRTLPGLRLHFNEDKLVTLKHVLVRLLGPEYGVSREMSTQTHNNDKDNNEDEEEDQLALFGFLKHDNEVDVSSKLLLAHFWVNNLSIELELQSSRKPVAEVQVTNMKAGITRSLRPRLI